MPLARLALAVVTAGIVLAACGGDDGEAGADQAQRTDRTAVEPTIIRTPVQVSEAPAVVPLPGPKSSPGTSADQQERSEHE